MDGLTKWRSSRELIPWRPFSTWWDRELGDFWEEFSEAPWAGSLGLAHWTPRVESLTKNGSYVIKADLPGVNPKDIHVTVEGEHLIIEGERKMDREMKRKEFRRREVFYGAFRRSVPIPRGLKAEAIKAKYHDGVLEITAPVEKGYLPKEVKVEVEKV